jgi:hypothetical protein
MQGITACFLAVTEIHVCYAILVVFSQTSLSHHVRLPYMATVMLLDYSGSEHVRSSQVLKCESANRCLFLFS